MRAGWLRLAALTAFLAVSCTSAHDAGQAASPSRTGSPLPVATSTFYPAPTFASGVRTDSCSAAQPAPVFPPSGPSTRKLALVSLSGSTDFVVRDITDINHPFTVSSLGSLVNYASKFVNDSEVSSTADGTLGLVRMPLSGSPLTVASACGSQPFAWSPDGTAAAYIRATADPKVQDLRIMSAGKDRVVDSMPALYFGVGCEDRGCADRWDIRILYSPDGAYISYVQLLPVSVFRIWTSSGKRLKSIDGSSATMSVWSGNTLYWRDDKGVEMWRDGTQSLLLPGVSWIRPKASQAGGQIVFETRDAATGTAHVFLLDTATGKARELAQSRSEPAFLTSRYVWYSGERLCKPSDNCVVGPTITTVPYIYDLQTGTEYRSIISTVWDVWPHAG
jgi:hypothetical protein